MTKIASESSLADPGRLRDTRALPAEARLSMSTVRRVAGAAAALTLCAALTGCEYIASTIPEVPAPSPTAASKPGETAMQRQMRLDYAAAEKAYRVSSVEGGRLIGRGADKPSAAFEAVATGQFADLIMTLARQQRDSGYTVKGDTVIRGVVEDGYQDKKIQLLACEDVTEVRLLKEGKRVKSNSSPYYVQHLTVIKTDATTWKVSDVDTTQLKSLEGQSCNAT